MASPLRVAARLAPDIALVALIVVGVFRPQLPDVLKANWMTSVVLLGATAGLLRLKEARRLRREGQKDPFRLVLGSVFALTLVALYIQPQRVASDGVHYFATLRSIVVDGDLDFENEYRILGAQEGYFLPTDTGRLPNNFSVGPALFWSPTYLVVHGLGHAGLFRPTGIGYPYFTAISTVTAFGGFLESVVAIRVGAPLLRAIGRLHRVVAHLDGNLSFLVHGFRAFDVSRARHGVGHGILALVSPHAEDPLGVRPPGPGGRIGHPCSGGKTSSSYRWGWSYFGRRLGGPNGRSLPFSPERLSRRSYRK